MKNYIIDRQENILDALKKIFPDSSNRTLLNMIKHKRVLINDNIVERKDLLVEEKSTVTISDFSRKISNGIEILYKDLSLIIIIKPKGLLSVPLDTGHEYNVLEELRKHFNTQNIYPVHRIDKETSGIMIFARGKKSTLILNKMFKTHDFSRVYTAIVLGNVKNDKGIWESKLIEEKNYHVHSTKNENEGRTSITHYKVLKRNKKYSLLELLLKTGRKHQIRVHCREAGHPIVGDKRYGSKLNNPIFRICLHASLLEFHHPITGKKMSFQAPLPKEFKKLL